MRLIALLAIAGLVAGCDGPGTHESAQAPAPPPVHYAAAPPPAQPVASATPTTHRRHSAHGDSQRPDSAYADEDSPSYVSESRSYDEDESEPESPAPQGDHYWVDGYRRVHYAEAPVRRVEDTRARRDPWHAYKSKCEDKERE